ENVLANIDKISGTKRKENLRAAGDNIKLSRQLVALKTDVPMTLDWENWRLQDADVPAFVALCREWGFRSLAEQVKSQAPVRTPVAVGAGARNYVQGDLFSSGFSIDESGEEANGDFHNGQLTTDYGVRPKDNWQATYRLVDTPKKFEAFEKELKQQRRIAIDL